MGSDLNRDRNTTQAVAYQHGNERRNRSVNRKLQGSQLFKYLLLINLFEYLEAGAVPALLLDISKSFAMSAGQLGLLGGIVYVSLSVGGPIAGYLLRHYDHQVVIGSAIIINNIFTLLWALTPVNQSYSTFLFITIRFMMGLTQCAVNLFIPLWANEFAPKDLKTTWMSYQQASVPFGVMLGYIVASIVVDLSKGSSTFLGLLSWRWPFLLEVILITPFCIGIFLVPKELINVRITSANKKLRMTSQESTDDIGVDNPLVPNVRTPLNSKGSSNYSSTFFSPMKETTITIRESRGPAAESNTATDSSAMTSHNDSRDSSNNNNNNIHDHGLRTTVTAPMPDNQYVEIKSVLPSKDHFEPRQWHGRDEDDHESDEEVC